MHLSQFLAGDNFVLSSKNLSSLIARYGGQVFEMSFAWSCLVLN